MRNRKTNQGFTIIELLVVILIIICLLAIVGATYAGIAKRDRNNERKNDIELVASQLETYNAKYNKYPSLTEINDTAWRKKNLKTIGNERFRDPSSSSYDLVATPKTNAYAYKVTAADGSSCDNQKKNCVRYTITTTYEGGGTYTKSSLN